MTGFPRRIGTVVTLVLAVFLAVWPAAAAEPVAFTWSDSRLPVPAGLATDKDHGVYWTANTSPGATTSLFAVDPAGKVKGRVTLATAARGPEAVAYDGGRIFVADVGAAKGSVTVSYAVVATVADTTLTYRSWDFVYPDSSEVTRALLVGPSTQLHLVTSSGRVYAAPATPTAQGQNRLTKVADLPSGIVGGSSYASGVMLRTAGELMVVDRATWQVVARTSTPAQQSPRGVTSALDGAGALLSGQGVGTPVVVVPTPSAAPSPTATPTATATAVTGPQIGGEKVSRTGTFVALGGALALALVAALVAFARR